MLHCVCCILLHPACGIVACCTLYRDITLRAADGSDERYQSELGTEMPTEADIGTRDFEKKSPDTIEFVKEHPRVLFRYRGQ